jgi:hypothetical protein
MHIRRRADRRAADFSAAAAQNIPCAELLSYRD